MIDFVVVAGSLASNTADLEARMRRFCDMQRGAFCKSWSGQTGTRAKCAADDDRQMNSQFAQYNRNRNTGYDCFMLFNRGNTVHSSGAC